VLFFSTPKKELITKPKNVFDFFSIATSKGEEKKTVVSKKKTVWREN
jgi:hypothetical protein